MIFSQGSNLDARLSELTPDTLESVVRSTRVQVEKDHLFRIWWDAGGVVSKAAVRLSIPPPTSKALMRKLSISRRDLSALMCPN